MAASDPSSSSKLSVHTSQITEIADEVAAHPLQRFSRTWNVSTGDSDALRKLRLVTPGLTVVRVNPTPLDGAAHVARVRVSSDESQHIDRVRVVAKRHNELRVEFSNDTKREGDAERGTLVVEIDLVHSQQIEQLVATGGGAVTVHAGVIASDLQKEVLLAALHESKLWVDEVATQHVQLKELLVGSSGGGEVYLDAKDLTVRETVGCGVLGDGRIHVNARRLWAATSQVGVVGDGGALRINAKSGFATGSFSGLVRGTGECSVQSSPAVEFGPYTTCSTQRLTVEGGGSCDVAGVPTESCRVKIRGGGRVVVQARQKLRVDSCASATIECVGPLPPDAQSPRKTKNVSCVSQNDRLAQQRIQVATNAATEVPAVLTIKAAFDAPVDLYVHELSFSTTFLQPFLDTL